MIGEWTNYSGNGYPTSEKEVIVRNQRLIWSSPLHVVFYTEATALQNIWSFPGITQLPNEIIEKIAPLNQEITNFKSYLDKISSFSSSVDSTTAINIENKLWKRRDSLNKEVVFSEKEIEICDKLLDMYKLLHFQIIGDLNTNRLHRKHKALLNLVIKNLKKL